MSGRRRTEQAAEAVEVRIPSKPEFVSVARLRAAAVAARLSFTYDEIEDLKIAVGEACTALILSGNSASHPITLRFIPEAEALEVRIETQGPGLDLDVPPAQGKRPLDQGRLGIFLMKCLVDKIDVHHSEEHGTSELRLVKRRQR